MSSRNGAIVSRSGSSERTAVAEKRAHALRELASQIAQTEQRERKQLAKALHDDLQQLLVAARLRLFQNDKPAPADDLQRASDLLAEALGKSRALVTELSPPVLHHGSLADALCWLGRHMEEQHSLKVDVQCDGNLEDVDENTRTLVFEAVRELLFNVVKHADSGKASLTAKQRSQELIVRVSDSGKGFDAESVTERSDGFGLFSIRERIDAFGGTLKTDTAPGEGAQITLALPLVPGKPPSAGLKPPRGTKQLAKPGRSKSAGDSLRVLVADDHRIVREGLIKILSATPGLEVVGEAEDGHDAIEQTRQLRPDVVVMDISMPRLNGIEATREITRQLPSVLVIGLSLHEQEELGAAIREAGAVTYLQKDVASTELVQAIFTHCRNDSDAGRTDAVEESPPRGPEEGK